ncbi:MAG TPA: PIN domain-containing protein [Verrucomicrobiae bacterium]|jgi:predicted nucleic acid-binding protein
MRTRRDLCVYFDACVYLAYYRQETASYGKPRVQAIQSMLEENKRGGSTIITSSLTICEVIDRLLESDLRAEIDDFKNRFKFGIQKLIDVEPLISEKAAQYRHFYRKNPITMPNRADKPFKNLATPDAIHLATAVIYECDEFWTLDGLNVSADKHQSIKPLWLKNNVAGDSIIITPPSMPQGALPLNI